MRKITQHSMVKKNLRIGEATQNTHRERERHKEYLYYQECNSYNNEQPTFTKGYKVTLYSDSLRATALYANYTDGPNMGTQRG